MITPNLVKDKTVIFDIESNGLLDTMDTIHCIALVLEDGESQLFGPDQIEEALDILKHADTIVGHNIINFDIPAIQMIYPDWSPNGLVRDTLVIVRVQHSDVYNDDAEANKLTKDLWGRHSLKAWGYRIDEYKGDFGETSDWDTYTEDMGLYCLQDTIVNLKLWKCLKGYSEQAIDLEHKFFCVLEKQMAHGWDFDVESARKLETILLDKKQELHTQLSEAFPAQVKMLTTPEYWIDDQGFFEATYPRKQQAPRSIQDSLKPGPMRTISVPFNPGSRDQVAEVLIQKYKWKPTEKTETGKPKLNEETLDTLDYPEIDMLKEYLMVKKRLGQLSSGAKAWLKYVKEDGRIYGRINHNGTLTGRCSHSRPNLGQVPAVRAIYGTECRSLFTVPPGYKLVGCDASGLELRCLAHYTYIWDKGTYVRDVLEGDIHTTNQKAAGLQTRDQAKTFIYALNYGAGDAKIGSIMGGSSAEGKKIKAKFFEQLPGLKKLMTEVRLTAERRGHIQGLDGRPLSIRAKHAALNVLLQSAGAIIMKQATVLIDEEFTKRGWTSEQVQQVGHIHDEVQIKALEELADEVGEIAVSCIEKTTQILGLDCPMTGEYKIGNNWADTH